MTNYEPYVSPAAELYHWGIRGQKWGRARYQNPDGTWTEEGLQRRRAREKRVAAAVAGVGALGVAAAGVAAARSGRSKKEMSDEDFAALGKRNGQKAAIRKAVDADNKEAQDRAKTSNDIGKEGLNIAKTIRNNRLERQRDEIMRNMDLSEMTNKDLQDYITRKNLEKQYKNLAVEEMELGQTFTDKVLDRAGEALAIGGSAIGIALGIRKLLYG